MLTGPCCSVGEGLVDTVHAKDRGEVALWQDCVMPALLKGVGCLKVAPPFQEGVIALQVLDARSGAHLGHVFSDGPKPTGKRFCMNAASMSFIKDGEEAPPESLPVKESKI